MQLTIPQRYCDLKREILMFRTMPAKGERLVERLAELEKQQKEIVAHLKTSVISGTSEEFNSAISSVTELLKKLELAPFLTCASEIALRLDKKDITIMVPSLELIEAISHLPETDPTVSSNMRSLSEYGRELSAYVSNAFFYRELAKTGERESFESAINASIRIDASFAVTQLIEYMKFMVGKAEQKLRVERSYCQNAEWHALHRDGIMDMERAFVARDAPDEQTEKSAKELERKLAQAESDNVNRRLAERDRLFAIADELPKKHVIAGTLSLMIRLIELARDSLEVISPQILKDVRNTIQSARYKIEQLVSCSESQ